MRRLSLFVTALLLVLGIVPATNAVVYPDATQASPKTAPWVVSLWRLDDYLDRGAPEGSFFCTGSLIGPHTVVTAAHCLAAVSGSAFVIVQGQSTNLARGKVLMPRDYRVNPDYDPTTMANDIALVDTYDEVVTTYLKLPNYSQAKAALAAGPVLYGWGRNQKQQLPRYLRQAKLQNLTAKGSIYFDDFNVKLQLAAGRKNANGTYTGACYGDSGGPLVGTYLKKKYLLGVTSFGSAKGCLVKVPTVFTRVTSQSAWLAAAALEFAQSRTAANIDLARARYLGTLASPLPVTAGVSGTGKPYLATLASFVTEAIDLDEADLSDLTAISYGDGGENLGQVELRLAAKAPWSSDGCDFQNLGGVGASVTLAVGDGSKTLWRGVFTGGRCASAPQLVAIEDRTSALPGSCEVEFTSNADGTFSFWLQRSCLPTPATTWLRVVLNTSVASDVEPGLDLWAGPFDLRDVA